MTEDIPRRRRRGHRTLAAFAALVVALAAAGCGSSSSSSSATSTGSASNAVATTTTQSSSGVAYAKAQVAKFSGLVTSFPPPGPSLKNVGSLKGKTVYYVPITLQDPEFSIVAGALKTAFSQVGVNVVACSGDANPSGVAACLGRAKAANASAVIVDSVPVVLAANAFAAVRGVHIPVLVTDQLPPPAALPGAVAGNGNDKLGYEPENGIGPLALIANWVIADSNGKANVLISEFTDSPSTQEYIGAGAVTQFKRYCPGCTVQISRVQNSNFPLIPSQTSASLLSNPNTNYVIAEFDAELQALYGGVQKAGFASKVKGASTTGILGALQQIKSKQFLAADAGTNFPYQGWADADASMRQMLGMPLVQETIPMRLFTADNIDSLSLTPAAQASGEWYGSSAYQEMFKKLWGK